MTAASRQTPRTRHDGRGARPLPAPSPATPHGARPPAPQPSFEDALRTLCKALVARASARHPWVALGISTAGTCPQPYQATLLRVADELVANAMEHAFVGRRHGSVLVHAAIAPDSGMRVSVGDDGAGFDRHAVCAGNGFRLLSMLGDLAVGPGEAPWHGGSTVTVTVPFGQVTMSPAAFPRPRRT